MKLFRIIHKVIKPGGKGYISVKKGEGEGVVEEEAERFGKGFKRFFAYYSQDEFAKVLKRNKFEILEMMSRQGTNVTWLVYFVKK
ncbi:MAG: hypothetical protein Q7S61_00520 [bacterium]|nr:hypothetical protein [bacterium]